MVAATMVLQPLLSQGCTAAILVLGMIAAILAASAGKQMKVAKDFLNQIYTDHAHCVALSFHA